MAKLDIYRRLIGYLRPYWPQATLAYTAMLFATLLNLFVPLIIKGAWTTKGLIIIARGRCSLRLGSILAIAVVRGIAGFVQRYFGEWLSFRGGLRPTQQLVSQPSAPAFRLPRPGAYRRSNEPGHG